MGVPIDTVAAALGAWCMLTSTVTHAQPRPDLDARADVDIQPDALVHRSGDLDLRLGMPLYQVPWQLGSNRDPSRLLGALRLTVQTKHAFGVASIWGSSMSLRIPKLLCWQPSFGGGTPPRMRAGVEYACHGLRVGSEVFVAGTLAHPDLLDVTTREFLSYSTSHADVGLSHFVEWLGAPAVGEAPQSLSATAGVRTTPSGPAVRASTFVPLAALDRSFSSLSAAGRF